MTMKWKKPNGNEIEVNDDKATIEYCESLGWKRMNGLPPDSEVLPGGGDPDLKGEDPPDSEPQANPKGE